MLQIYMQALPPPSPRDQPLPAIKLGCIPISEWREEGRLGSSPWRALNTGDLDCSARSFKESFSFRRLTVVQGQGPQYPSKMSLDIFGRMGALMVVKQLCRNPNCPVLEMGKAPAKEGGCLWSLKMKIPSSSSFLLLPDLDLSRTIVYLLCHLESFFNLSKCNKLSLLK